MKIHVGKINKTPFEVPSGNYVGTCFRHRPAKKACYRGCALDTQFVLDFSLIDEHGHDEGYLASVQLCSKCKFGTHMARYFLEQWLRDRFYDFIDSDGDIDLDELLQRKADIRITHHHGAGHTQPFSKLEQALPLGTLIE